MRLYRTKLGRLINFIKNDGKFEYGEVVKIVANNLKDRPDYDKYVGQYGKLKYIDYEKKDCIFIVKFADGKFYGFDEDEIQKVSDKEYWSIRRKDSSVFDNIIV